MFDASIVSYYDANYKLHQFVTNHENSACWRMRQKLVWNVQYLRQRFSHHVTLTIDPEHYDQLTCDQPLSHHFRKFMNAVRMAQKRRNSKLDYFYRIERGTRNTKRLHIHMLVNTTSPFLKWDIQRLWKYCQWETQKEDWFEGLDQSDRVSMYLSKYTSKASGSNRAYPKELNSRLFGSSRSLVQKPKEFNLLWHKDYCCHGGWYRKPKQTGITFANAMSLKGVHSSQEFFDKVHARDIFLTQQNREDLKNIIETMSYHSKFEKKEKKDPSMWDYSVASSAHCLKHTISRRSVRKTAKLPRIVEIPSWLLSPDFFGRMESILVQVPFLKCETFCCFHSPIEKPFSDQSFQIKGVPFPGYPEDISD